MTGWGPAREDQTAEQRRAWDNHTRRLAKYEAEMRKPCTYCAEPIESNQWGEQDAGAHGPCVPDEVIHAQKP